MKKSNQGFYFMLLVCLVFKTTCYADFVGVERVNGTANSPDDQFIARIPEVNGYPNSPGTCIIQVFKRKGEYGFELVWKRALINDYWPCEIFVTNNGEVITLDDSSRYGKFPVVMYSKTGKLSYLWRMSDFPEIENNKAIKETESGLRWREKCTYYLSEVADLFVIVPPNKEPIFIRFDLPSLTGADPAQRDALNSEMNSKMKAQDKK